MTGLLSICAKLGFVAFAGLFALGSFDDWRQNRTVWTFLRMVLFGLLALVLGARAIRYGYTCLWLHNLRVGDVRSIRVGDDLITESDHVARVVVVLNAAQPYFSSTGGLSKGMPFAINTAVAGEAWTLAYVGREGRTWIQFSPVGGMQPSYGMVLVPGLHETLQSIGVQVLDVSGPESRTRDVRFGYTLAGVFLQSHSRSGCGGYISAGSIVERTDSGVRCTVHALTATYNKAIERTARRLRRKHGDN